MYIMHYSILCRCALETPISWHYTYRYYVVIYVFDYAEQRCTQSHCFVSQHAVLYELVCWNLARVPIRRETKDQPMMHAKLQGGKQRKLYFKSTLVPTLLCLVLSRCLNGTQQKFSSHCRFTAHLCVMLINAHPTTEC